MDKKTVEKAVKALSGHYCVFRDNPYTTAPYAIFASGERAAHLLRTSGGLSGPLTFEEWLEDFNPPSEEVPIE